MKRVLFSVLVVLGSVFSANSQVKSETDLAVEKFQGMFNSHKYDQIYDLLSERSQKVITKDKMTEAMSSLNKQVGDMKTFAVKKNQEKLTYYKVTFTNMDLILITSLSDDNKFDAFRFAPDKGDNDEKGVSRDKAPGASPLVLRTGTGEIHGTLTVPSRGEKFPVVLLIAGSGPTDRDGNNDMGLKTNSYRMIAEELQKVGVACIRYDKRGIGESAASMKDEASIVFDDFVADAMGFMSLLKQDPRFTEIIVMGHSEGSLIGMIAAQKGNASKYISIAGAGQTIDKVIHNQIMAQSPALAKKADIVFDSLKKGFTVHRIETSQASLFRPSIQPFLRSWLKYDPQKEIAKLKMPVLLLQGETDLQVSMKDAENLKKAARSGQLVTIKQMNHVLKNAPKDKAKNMETYSQPELPLSDGFMAAVVKFIIK